MFLKSVLIILFLYNCQLFCQKINVIRVVNQDKLAVTAASIYFNDTLKGITNNEGLFFYTAQKAFKLKITALSYEAYLFDIDNNIDSLIVKLKIKYQQLQSVNVIASNKKPKEKTFGTKHKKPSGIFHSAPDMLWLLKINLTKEKNVWIKSINYFLKEGKNEDVSAPFKVLLYDNDTTCNCPGKLIIDELIVSGAKNKKWFNVDISNERIRVDSSIIYIGLQTMAKSFYDKPLTTKYYSNYYVQEYKIPSVTFLQKKSEDSYLGWDYFKPIKWVNNQFKLIFSLTLNKY